MQSGKPAVGTRWADVLRHVLGRGVFPEKLAWFLEGSWRRLVLSPETLARRLPPTTSATVCEIGIGGGYYGRALAKLAHRFIGLDIQLGMLRRVASRADGRGLLLVQADATRLPLASESIDLVIAVTVLGEVPSAPATLQEVVRVLRPGGTLSVSEHFPDPDYIRFDQLRTMCEESGLRFERKHGRRVSYTATFTKALS